MKKITLLAIGALMVLGCGALVGHAHAADSISASQAMGQENAKILQQSLNVLGTVLNDLNTQIDTNGLPADTATINAELTAIHDGLLSIHSLIASFETQARALAKNNALNESPTVAAQPSTLNPAANTQNNEVASASIGGNLNKFLWPTLVVLVIVAGTFFLRRKNPNVMEGMDREPSTLEDRNGPEDPESFSYLPTITDY